MKQHLLHFMVSGGFFSPIRHFHRGKAVVLTYHRFGDKGNLPPGPATSVADFTRHLEHLARHYKVVPLSHLLEVRRDADVYPPRLAAITIDDGYADTFSHAYPVLRRFGFPATLFVATSFIDGRAWLWTDRVRFAVIKTKRTECPLEIDGITHKFPLEDGESRLIAADRINAILKTLPDEVKDRAIARLQEKVGIAEPARPTPEFAPLTWDHLRLMADEGMDVGSHSETHPILTRVSDESLRAEVRNSRSRLESMLQRSIEMFCFPNGSHDARVRAEVARAGYRAAFSTDGGLDDPRTNALAIKRIGAEANFDRFVQAVSGFESLRAELFPKRRPVAN